VPVVLEDSPEVLEASQEAPEDSQEDPVDSQEVLEALPEELPLNETRDQPSKKSINFKQKLAENIE